ncbi:MAG TPA: hypothetical protein VMS92_06930 [Mycobacterium sp.]|nr:hypothetical protein [Mycobacterium sp.]
MNLLPAVVALSAVLLAACAGSPAAMEHLSEAELWNAQPTSKCNAYHYSKSEKMRKALTERVDVYPENWPAVAAGQVKIGFTEVELICARGYPRKINESASAAGVRKQWVYGGTDRYMPTEYFYTDGRHVTGWN